jgi:hypothetical protein
MAQPLLLSTARIFIGGAERVAENTLGPRFARESRLGRALPTRKAVAHGLTAVAVLMTAAANLAVPPPPTVELPARPEPNRPVLVVRRPRQAELRLAGPEPVQTHSPKVELTLALRPSDNPDLDATTVAAIRALIDEMRNEHPTGPPATPQRPKAMALSPPSGRVLLTHEVPLTPAEPRPLTLGERLSARSFRLAAGLVAGTVTVLTLPVGLVRAVLTHLHGNDLRTWS